MGVPPGISIARTTGIPGDAGGETLRVGPQQRLAPVEPASQPDEGETGSIRGTARFEVAFLVERQLFTQKEIPRRKHGAWAQAKAQEPQCITEEPQQRTCARSEVAELVCESDHR
jgi:hypothetical protein